MELQHKIGADIHMAFDELTSPLAGREQIKSALDKTHKWAEKCLIRHNELNKCIEKVKIYKLYMLGSSGCA